jgi:hypothetical protein
VKAVAGRRDRGDSANNATNSNDLVRLYQWPSHAVLKWGFPWRWTTWLSFDVLAPVQQSGRVPESQPGFPRLARLSWLTCPAVHPNSMFATRWLSMIDSQCSMGASLRICLHRGIKSSTLVAPSAFAGDQHGLPNRV